MRDLLSRARSLDAADPLAQYRARFAIPDGVVYLDGNSLGALPLATKDRLAKLVQGEWGDDLIRGWNPTDRGGDWIAMPQRIGAIIAPLIGAGQDEVIACDSVSVNLAKLIGAALAMRPGRKVVLSEPGNFPTDLYMVQGSDAQQRLAERDAIIDVLAAEGSDVALLLLTHVHYKTGAMHDMAALTRAAHQAGALVLWDLSHSGGAVSVDLNGCDADFAVGCGYKYFNGGPGAPSYLFVAERHQDQLKNPISGWMGHAAPFAFTDDYQPAKGVSRMLAGTPPILAMTALECGVELIAEIGIAPLVAKSRALMAFFIDGVAESCPDLPCVSPVDPTQRGSHLSFRHPDAYAICQALIAQGVIGDFRDPDLIRFGFAPAYVRFEDAARAVGALAQVLQDETYLNDEFRCRTAVT